MTRADFYHYLHAYDCITQPIEGNNNTGYAVRIVNEKNGGYHYFQTPINEKPIPDKEVIRICTSLGVPLPAGVGTDQPK